MKNRIRLLMEKENLNAKSFSLRTGVSQSTLSHIFSGRNGVSNSVVMKIEQAFPLLNPDWLTWGKEPMYRGQEPVQGDLFAQDSDFLPKNASTEPQSATIFPEKTKETTVNQPLVKEIVREVPVKEIRRIVVYFTDGTYKDFLNIE